MPNNDFGHNFTGSCRILLKFCTPPRDGQYETFLLNNLFSKFNYLAGRGTCGFAENAKMRLNSAFELKPNAAAPPLGNRVKVFCQLHSVSAQKPNLVEFLHFRQNHKSLSWPNT